MEDMDKVTKLEMELKFMYNKYEELCVAYKKLATSLGKVDPNVVHDMSKMKFAENNKGE
jgi:hypothetical protein